MRELRRSSLSKEVVVTNVSDCLCQPFFLEPLKSCGIGHAYRISVTISVSITASFTVSVAVPVTVRVRASSTARTRLSVP